MNSFQPFQAWILSAALHALTFIVLVGPAYELVGDEKARRVIHRASFKDPSQSPKYSSQMLIFKWLMSSSAPEQSEDLIFFLCSMVFYLEEKNVSDGNLWGKTDFFPDSAAVLLLLLLLLISNTALLSPQLTLFTVTVSEACHCSVASVLRHPDSV